MSAAGMLVLLVPWSVFSMGLSLSLQGGLMTFTPKGMYPDGTYRVDFRYKESYRNYCHQEFSWDCSSGDCGYTRELRYGQIDSSPLGDSWCQAEGFMSRSVPGDKPFDLSENGCCWFFYLNEYPSWMLSTHVDLGVRSDTGIPNRSPVTTLPPRLRVPQNCPTTYSMLAYDPDGDHVKCRYGKSNNSECSICAQPAGFGLNEILCELSYYGSQSGEYMFELVMEDFPQRHIQLQYSDGSAVSKSPLYSVRKRKRRETNLYTTTTTPSSTEWSTTVETTTTAPYTTTPRNSELTMNYVPTLPAALMTSPGSWPQWFWLWWNQHSTTTATYTTTTPSNSEWSTTTETITTAPSTSTSSNWWWSTTEQTATTAPYTTTPSNSELTMNYVPTLPAALMTSPGSWPQWFWLWWNQHSTTTATYTTTTPSNSEWSTTTETITTAPSTSTSSNWWWSTTEPTATTAPYTITPSNSELTMNYVPTLPAALMTSPGSWPQWFWLWWNQHSTTTATYTTTTPSNSEWSTTMETITTAPSTSTSSNWWWSTTEPTATTAPYTTIPTPYTTSQSGWRPTTQTSTYSPPTDYNPLSKIPIQFIVEVISSVPSCNFGDYRPQYLSPTPSHGQIRKAFVNSQFQFTIRAQASYAVIDNIMISGPLNITKSYQYDNQTRIGEAQVTWTPSENDQGESIPICFFAETHEGYQSELRCVVVTVGRHNFLPLNAEASVVCTETTMSMFVLKSSVPGLNEQYMRLNDPRCSLTSNSTHLIASVSLNSCGTRYQENDTEIIFQNEITKFDQPNQVISRKNQVEIPFSCSYPKIGTASATFSPHKANYLFSEAGFGSFTFVFEFYDSSNFTSIIDPSEYPIEVELGQMLYMSISVESQLDNIVLFVQDCRATPHDDPNDPTYYDIISDGCVQDDTTIIFPSNQTEFRFGMAAFTFIGDYSQVYMTCTVILCTVGSPGTRCSQGCVNSTSAVPRYRRSLASESQEHFISQGPLYLERKNQYNDKLSLNPNSLVIVVGFIAAVAAVAGIVIYKIKMSKVVQYERLPPSEC
ncbi:cell wall protein DAN4-like [Polypterus senegalus]|uniref:cell wall protein DAN4-like n=1 Tax=Polypterus senegalus TaxID=55291 RepID=UPI0019637B27|nr:cell wall protein DAN4-like [Polypterus senegalus]